MVVIASILDVLVLKRKILIYRLFPRKTPLLLFSPQNALVLLKNYHHL